MARRSGNSTATLGGNLGPKLAKMIADAMTIHLHQSAGVRAQIGAQGAVQFFETIRAERHAHSGDIMRRLLGHPQTAPEMEKLLQFVAHGHGEWASVLEMAGVTAGFQTGVGQLISNLLAPTLQYYISKDPHSLLSPQEAAEATIAGHVTSDWGYEEAAKSGINNERFALMMELQRGWPTLSQLLELWRRGHINEGQFREALVRQGLHPTYVNLFVHLFNDPLSPEMLALMVLKGIKDKSSAAAEAQQSGIDGERFDELILATGEPPGLMQLLEAYRRGYIDEKRLEKGVRQSRVRDEWIDVVKDLRFERASPADAINAYVQGHLNHDQAKKIAEDGGLYPEDFEWVYETYGEPMAIMQSIELWRRHEVTQHQVEEAIREGHTKDKYIPRYLKLRRVLPAQYQIEKMVETGGISQTLGAKLLREQGYDPDVVKGLIFRATHAKVAKNKALAASTIETLYHDRVISEAEAVSMLKQLGYSDANARFMLRLVDLKREQTLQNAAMSPVRTEYVNRMIDRAEAEKRLTQLGIEKEQLDFALTLWTADREAHRKVLSEAQIIKANTNGLLDDHACEQRLMTLGYTLEDARILMDNEKGRVRPAP